MKRRQTLNTIKQFFNQNLLIQPDDGHANVEHKIQLATAALLIELSRADFEESDIEVDAVVAALQKTYQLSAEEIQQLIALANTELEQSTSLYQFTRLVNDHFDYERKQALIGSLWHVAYADGEVDRYEDHMIRKVADLIYVKHSDFIRLKLAASTRYGQA